MTSDECRTKGHPLTRYVDGHRLCECASGYMSSDDLFFGSTD